jgi:hypothetical protein
MVLAACLLAAGCSDTAEPASAPQRTPSALGGDRSPGATPPARPMNIVERTIAGDLSSRLSEQQLTLDYLDCPDFDDRSRPQKVTCRGYVDGVLADVRVSLWGPADHMQYDAMLDDGVLATANLVRRLEAQGYREIDCGERPAYRSHVGDQIICTVVEAARQKYVVATVTTDGGEVEISDY